MNIEFAGKVVLVAGGTGGLGKSVSLAFLEAGATVAVTYRKTEEFAALKSAPVQPTLHSRAIPSMSPTKLQRPAWRTKFLAQHGRLDALVNTAGGYIGGIKFWELETKVFEQMFALNVRSSYVLSRAVLPIMLRQKHGAIVNVAAKAALDHAAGASAYAASKAAAVAMLDSLAADLKGTGVRANSILPSVIDTEVNRRAMPDANFLLWPKPQDIASVILFLCSDAAKVVQGAAITVYGDS